MIRFFFGDTGSGKTEHCLESIFSRRGDNHRDNNLIYLVPEQFSLQSEKNLIRKSGGKALTNVFVLSFQRLCYYLFRETGQPAGKYLDDTGRLMVLRKLAGELSGSLSYFKNAYNRPGFISKLSDSISEFKQCSLTPERLGQLFERDGISEGLRLKMRDIRLLYAAFTDYMENKYISYEENLDIACQKLDKSTFIKGSSIWIDGFFGFTVQELTMIARLMCCAEEINIYLTCRIKSLSYTGINASDPFFQVKDTVNRLMMLASENNARVDEPVLLTGYPRYAVFPELERLVVNFFDNGKYEQADNGNIIVRACGNRHSELSFIAEEIDVLVREKDCRYRDIAVLTGGMGIYERVIQNRLELHDIPYFIDTKTDILFHPFTELVLSAIDIILYNWSYEAVFRFLKTRLCGIPLEDIYELENYVIEYGIKSYRWTQERWKYGFGAGKYDEARIHNIRDSVLDILLPFTLKKNADTMVNVTRFAESVFELLSRADIKKADEDWDREYNMQVWSGLVSVFDKLVEILGDDNLRISELAKIIEAGFNGIDIGRVPPSQDQVIIGDLERTRLHGIKVLFVAGCNEGILPRAKTEHGVFNDPERILLRAQGMPVKTDEHTLNEELFLIYNALSKPTERLYVTYARSDTNGKLMRPSNIIGRIKRLTAVRVNDEQSGGENGFRLHNNKRPLFERLSQNYSKETAKNPPDPNFVKAYAWFSENAEYADRLKRLRDISAARLKDIRLSPQTIKKIYGDEIKLDVSRLERYKLCPFAYFAMYNLKAFERRAFELEAVDIGSLFHYVLESFAKKTSASGKGWKELNINEINSLASETVDEVIAEKFSDIFTTAARYGFVLSRVKKIIARSIWALAEHIKAGLFEPALNELVFGGSAVSVQPVTSINIAVNERQTLILSGRVDRIDVFDSEGVSYIKVIDYKSGRMKFNKNDIYLGMQLQLFVYLNVLLENAPKIFGASNIQGEVRPGGVFYFNIKDPIMEYGGDTDANPTERLLAAFKMSGLVLAQKDVLVAMDQGLADGGDSKIIPVSVKKSDGQLGARSSVAALEEFDELRQIVTKHIIQTATDMTSGLIGPFPFKKGTRSGCDYCSYHALCGVR